MKSNTVGVTVARFQVPNLHRGHKRLLTHLKNHHKHRIIFLGCTSAKGTQHDPLDFDTRKQMVLQFDPRATVLPIWDVSDDQVWSETLDDLIIEEVGPDCPVKLYSGPDGFLKYYEGPFTKVILPRITAVSGTEIRAIYAKTPHNSEAFRRGVIYGAYNQYPRVFPTVDIAITKPRDKGGVDLLLGSKAGSSKLCFIGGFVDIYDKGLVDAAARETKEEAPYIDFGGISKLQFVGSAQVSDWRYPAGTSDQVTTSLFHATYLKGSLVAGDDLVKLEWYPINTATLQKLQPGHKGLFLQLKKYLGRP